MAVIALLVALLLPALSTARNAAKDTQCLANVRQLGFASLNYTVDNQDYWCSWATPADVNIASVHERAKSTWISRDYAGARWMDTIWLNYLNRNIAVMECPLQTLERPNLAIYSYQGPGGQRKYWPGYLVNRRVTYESFGTPRAYTPRRVRDFRDPSDKILHADSGLVLNGYPNVKPGWGPVSSTNATGQGGISGAGLANRHRLGSVYHSSATLTNITGGSNLFFVDGHGGYIPWIEGQPWNSSNANPQNHAAYNQGFTIYKKYWDPNSLGTVPSSLNGFLDP